MNRRLVWRIRQATSVGFAGALLLIVLGATGRSASLVLALALLALGVIGVTFHRHLQGVLDNPAFDAYLTALPAAPMSAGGVMVLYTGASPGELQTLGGVLGLLAVSNHLLRPIYGLVAQLLTRLAATLS
ncbi:MAG: hypothetical protein ACOCP2_03265 [Halohasta sp.]